MILEYVEAAMTKAKYEIIEDEEPFYGEIPVLRGVWATGKTLELCRRNLREALEGWITVRLRQGLSIPPIGQRRIERPRKVRVNV
jgi:predicted RNase H-like HicB family nuclease